jgi:septal ring factor EnvC (AmiA/AmiB activator)
MASDALALAIAGIQRDLARLDAEVHASAEASDALEHSIAAASKEHVRLKELTSAVGKELAAVEGEAQELQARVAVRANSVAKLRDAVHDRTVRHAVLAALLDAIESTQQGAPDQHARRRKWSQ